MNCNFMLLCIFWRYVCRYNVGLNVGLNTTEKKVLSHLLENPEATADDMAVAIDVTKRTIERTLKKSREKGLLVRSGAKKSGSWIVIK